MVVSPRRAITNDPITMSRKALNGFRKSLRTQAWDRAARARK
jgi:hypothetical protein